MGRVTAEFFAPRSIALVGASANSEWTRTVLAGLRDIGYDGDVHLVNRAGRPVDGRPAATSLREIGSPVDLAYLLVPRAGVLDAVTDARAAGVPGVVALASGYTESGEPGAKAQDELVRAAAGLVLLGPNGLGFVNYHRRVALFPPLVRHRAVAPGAVALVSQSGGVAAELLDPFAGHGVGLSLLVCTGNEAGLDLADVVDHLADDPVTSIICLFVEAVRRPGEFLAAARRAQAAGKTIVAVTVGHSRAAARVVAAHTGAIVGNDRSLRAALRSAGVLRVDSVEDLVATSALLLRGGRPARPGVAVTAISGGACSLIADAAERRGLRLAQFAEPTEACLRAALPDYARVQNPLDVTGAVIADPAVLAGALAALRRDPGVGLVLCQLPVPDDVPAATRLLAGVAPGCGPDPKLAPVVVCPGNGIPLSASALELTDRHGLPVVASSLESLVSSAAAVTAALEDAPQPGAGITGLHLPEPDERRRPWSEAQARDLLAENGIPVVPGAVCRSAAEAVRAASQLGYPVAVKASSAALVHKSDAGGVHLGLDDDGQVRLAFESVASMLAGLGEPPAVLVTPMRTGGVELIVGVIRDPDWGLLLAVGLGGIWTEVFDDVAVALLPAGAARVRSMFGELRARPLLGSFRGRAAVDLDRLTGLVLRVAALAHALGDDLALLEINPFSVRGAVAEALDATIIWSTQEGTG
jgi:acyl-CoA synthetase (NDP forming)